MNNLNANYERILEVLRKTSKSQFLPYQRRTPKMSDLELISLSLTAEYMGIDSENNLFRQFPMSLSLKIERSVYNRRRRRLTYYIDEIRLNLASRFNESNIGTRYSLSQRYKGTNKKLHPNWK